jgi:hypothetical protein
MSAQELQQDIERTRQRLGETVNELAAKADVKTRAIQKAAEARRQAAEMRQQAAEMGQKAVQRARQSQVAQRARQSQVAQRRWPLAVVAGLLVAGAAAAWRWRAR